MLTNLDIAELSDWRRALHEHPELSGAEHQTAATVATAMAELGADEVVTGLGGTGVAAIFSGAEPGPTVLFRAELDGLPIAETSDLPHRSQVAGRGHMCGHDGHMTILAGLGRLLARQRPARGRAILLFQPAEETGAGAAAVLADPRFAALRPDWAFALHNMPGLPFGQVALRPGPMACASAGLRAILIGRTAHAAAPETGLSPTGAVARLIPALTGLGPGGDLVPGFRLATLTHLRIGAPVFGISPGEAELWLTLRALLEGDMRALMAEAKELLTAEARSAGLSLSLCVHESFAACFNNPDASAAIARAVQATGIACTETGLPMRASEDFGRFSEVGKTAMFLIGSGAEHPVLHAPDFDFPDGLIAPGVQVFHQILRDLLG